MPDMTEDTWTAWLDEQRFSGGEQESRLKNTLREYRETVLDHAALTEDDRVLDVGAGDGLIAFGALERLGPEGTVIFSDLSKAVLEQARETAEELGDTDRCKFVVAPAQDLEPIADESIDVITLRSVLIYVERMEQTFEEFERVLKPGGRLSLFEPIGDFTRGMQGSADTFMGYDMDRAEHEIPDSVRDLFGKLWDYGQEHSPDHEAAMDFNERDLFGFVEKTGFKDIHLDLSAWNTVVWETEEWDSWLTTSFGPESPTKREAMEEALTSEERETFIDHIRPLIEAKKPKDHRGTTAYLWATKPAR